MGDEASQAHLLHRRFCCRPGYVDVPQDVYTAATTGTLEPNFRSWASTRAPGTAVPPELMTMLDMRFYSCSDPLPKLKQRPRSCPLFLLEVPEARSCSDFLRFSKSAKIGSSGRRASATASQHINAFIFQAFSSL